MTNNEFNYDFMDFADEPAFDPTPSPFAVEEEYVPFPDDFADTEYEIPFPDVAPTPTQAPEPIQTAEEQIQIALNSPDIQALHKAGCEFGVPLNNGQVLQFGQTITLEDPKPRLKFITLPEGEYEFKVTKAELGKFAGSQKMAPCDKVSLELRVETEDGVCDIKDTLFLLGQWKNRIYYYLTTTGMTEPGKPLTLEPELFTGSIGRTGKAKIVVDSFVSRRDGEKKTTNKVAFYLA